MITKFSEEQSKQFKEFLQNYNNWNSNEVDEVLENLMDLEEKFMEELILLPNFPKLIQDAIDNGSSIILITEKWVILDDITSELYNKIDSLDLFLHIGVMVIPINFY